MSKPPRAIQRVRYYLEQLEESTLLFGQAGRLFNLKIRRQKGGLFYWLNRSGLRSPDADSLVIAIWALLGDSQLPKGDEGQPLSPGKRREVARSLLSALWLYTIERQSDVTNEYLIIQKDGPVSLSYRQKGDHKVVVLKGLSFDSWSPGLPVPAKDLAQTQLNYILQDIHRSSGR